MFELNSYLINEFKNGNHEAAKVVYETIFRLIYHIAFSFLNNEQDAEDIVHETFMKLYDKDINVPHNHKAFISFACKTAQNLSLDLVRRKKFISDKEITDNDVSSNDKDVSNMLENIKKILTNEEYNVFIYKGYFELSYKDISPLVDKSPSRCRVIYHDARIKLQQNKEMFL